MEEDPPLLVLFLILVVPLLSLRKDTGLKVEVSEADPVR